MFDKVDAREWSGGHRDDGVFLDSWLNSLKWLNRRKRNSWFSLPVSFGFPSSLFLFFFAWLGKRYRVDATGLPRPPPFGRTQPPSVECNQPLAFAPIPAPSPDAA